MSNRPSRYAARYCGTMLAYARIFGGRKAQGTSFGERWPLGKKYVALGRATKQSIESICFWIRGERVIYL